MQLRNLAKTSAASIPPPPPPAPMPTPTYSYPTQQQPAFYQQPLSQSSTPLQPVSAPSFDLAALLQAASSSTPTPPSSSQGSQPVAAPSSSLIPSDLMKNLISAGLLNFPTIDQKPADAEIKQEENAATGRNKEYDDMIMAIDVQLTSGSIQRYVFYLPCRSGPDLTGYSRERSQMANILYNRLPLQCKQCAMRFPAGETGKKSMEDHLDLHFKQNRKASQNTGRGHSRSWFVAQQVSCFYPRTSIFY
jgi:pre-mRNA cleavage complex 2 protein Pcf11